MKRRINVSLTQLDNYEKTVDGVLTLLDSVILSLNESNPQFVIHFLDDLYLYLDTITHYKKEKDNEQS